MKIQCIALRMLKRTLRLAVFNRQMNEMRKKLHSITNREDDLEEGDIFYIQFPVYEIEFHYNKKKYQAYIDGSTGRVIHIDVPISRKFKLFSLIGGIGQMFWVLVLVSLVFWLIHLFLEDYLLELD